jgi:hypothetical protein
LTLIVTALAMFENLDVWNLKRAGRGQPAFGRNLASNASKSRFSGQSGGYFRGFDRKYPAFPGI